MFHTNLLYLFNIFCSPRLILVHLFWKSRRTLSDYMQKMNKPFTISTHTQTKRRRRRRKENIPGFEPAPSRFPHQISYCGLSMCRYSRRTVVSYLQKYVQVLKEDSCQLLAKVRASIQEGQCSVTCKSTRKYLRMTVISYLQKYVQVFKKGSCQLLAKVSASIQGGQLSVTCKSTCKYSRRTVISYLQKYVQVFNKGSCQLLAKIRASIQGGQLSVTCKSTSKYYRKDSCLLLAKVLINRLGGLCLPRHVC